MIFTNKEAFNTKNIKVKIHGKGNNAAISCLDCNFPVLLADFIKLGVSKEKPSICKNCKSRYYAYEDKLNNIDIIRVVKF